MSTATSTAVATGSRLSARVLAALIALSAALAVAIVLLASSGGSSGAAGTQVAAPEGNIPPGSGVALGRHHPDVQTPSVKRGWFPRGD